MPQAQKILPLDSQEQTRLDEQRRWVASHQAQDPTADFGLVRVKLATIQAVLDNGGIRQDQTWELQSLGVVFGDALAHYLSVPWVIVDDEYGRDPALKLDDDPTLLFPLTMISKRIEAGETVDVVRLYSAIVTDL